MSRFVDTRPPRRTLNNHDVDRLARTRSLWTHLTPSPEDPPVTWDHHGDDEVCDCGAGEREPCRCWTRGAS